MATPERPSGASWGAHVADQVTFWELQEVSKNDAKIDIHGEVNKTAFKKILTRLGTPPRAKSIVKQKEFEDFHFGHVNRLQDHLGAILEPSWPPRGGHVGLQKRLGHAQERKNRHRKPHRKQRRKNNPTDTKNRNPPTTPPGHSATSLPLEPLSSNEVLPSGCTQTQRPLRSCLKTLLCASRHPPTCRRVRGGNRVVS